MPGVRLHHRNLANCVFVADDLRRRYQVPFDCVLCGKAHDHKTYHLNLDTDGNVIVSPKVFERLREIGLIGEDLEVLNEVREPPPIIIGMELPNGLIGRFRIYEHKVERKE